MSFLWDEKVSACLIVWIPFMDEEGIYGISNRDKYVYLSNNLNHLQKLRDFLSSDLAFYLYNATRYRMKYLEKYIFSYLPNILF